MIYKKTIKRNNKEVNKNLKIAERLAINYLLTTGESWGVLMEYIRNNNKSVTYKRLVKYYLEKYS